MIKPDMIKTEEAKKRFSDFITIIKTHNITTIITVAAIAVIIVLSFLYYYYGIRLVPESSDNIVVVTVPTPPKKPETPPVTENPEPPQPPNFPEGTYTKIVTYIPSALANSVKNIKKGKCLSYSIAQPFREDTWRCVVENKSYDPCFAVDKDKMLCQNNPLKESDMFLVNLTDPPLPRVEKDNWAWFLTFDDGTYCAPYTGRRPQVEGEEVYYGCKKPAGNQTMVILGELKRGIKWTAETAILSPQNLQNNQWKISSIKEMEVKQVWQ